MARAYISDAEMKKALGNIEKLSDEARQKIGEQIQYTARDVEARAKLNTPVNEGRLRASIDVAYDPSTLTAVIKAGGSGAKGQVNYAPYVEFGTKTKVRVPSGYAQFASQYKGIRGGTFADLQRNIAQWAKAKGIPEEAVFPIAMSIAKKGIPAQPFLIPAFEGQRQNLIKRLKRVFK